MFKLIILLLIQFIILIQAFPKDPKQPQRIPHTPNLEINYNHLPPQTNPIAIPSIPSPIPAPDVDQIIEQPLTPQQRFFMEFATTPPQQWDEQTRRQRAQSIDNSFLDRNRRN